MAKILITGTSKGIGYEEDERAIVGGPVRDAVLRLVRGMDS